jgi:hypothetical protein
VCASHWNFDCTASPCLGPNGDEMYLVGLNNIILFPTKAELKAPVTDKLIAAIDDARRDRARAEFTGTSEFKVISDKSDASHQELETLHVTKPKLRLCANVSCETRRHEKEYVKLYLCKRCRQVEYCSSECLRFHWTREVGGHKAECKKVESAPVVSVESTVTAYSGVDSVD